MQTVKIFLFIAIGILVTIYIYILASHRKKTSIPFGKAKAIISVIQKHPNINARTTRKLDIVVHELEQYFCENGEINYEALLDVMAHVKQRQKGVDDGIGNVIDIISEHIRKTHPFLYVSSSCGAIFEKLDYDVKAEKFTAASEDVKLLYERVKEVESVHKRRSRREFWIGTVIGIMGIVVGIIGIVI